MTLLEHLKNINAKSKEKMKKEPGLWIGMITESEDTIAFNVIKPSEGAQSIIIKS